MTVSLKPAAAQVKEMSAGSHLLLSHGELWRDLPSSLLLRPVGALGCCWNGRGDFALLLYVVS